MALPGWDSPSSVVEIHAVLEAAALVFFAALVVFDVLAHFIKRREILLERIGLVCFGIAVLSEICAYPYSRRNDTLSEEGRRIGEAKIAALNKEAGDARQTAGNAEKAAADANERASKNEKEAALLRKQAAQLGKAAQDEMLARIQIQAMVSARHIPVKELSALASSLSKFRGKTVYLRSYANDPTDLRFCSRRPQNCGPGSRFNGPRTPLGMKYAPFAATLCSRRPAAITMVGYTLRFEPAGAGVPCR